MKKFLNPKYDVLFKKLFTDSDSESGLFCLESFLNSVLELPLKVEVVEISNPILLPEEFIGRGSILGG